MGEAADYDLGSGIHIADPSLFASGEMFEHFQRLRAEDPVHYCPDSPYGSYWSVTRYEDIVRVDKDSDAFSSDARLGGIIIDDGIFEDKESDFFVNSFISMDPPDHGPQRKAVSKIAAPSSIVSFEKLIRENTQNILDSLPISEEFDWVSQVSIELTTRMLAILLDFPFEDRSKLTRWSDVSTAEADSPIVGSQEQRVKELFECLEYFSALKSERATGPAKLDLVTMLAQDAATRNQPDAEFLGSILLLIVGGNDTTRNSMSGAINAFNQYPDQFSMIKADPTLIPSAVSEIIRWQTPLAHMRRTAVQDAVIGNKQIKKGDKVVMWYVSGNRDTEVFEEPDHINIERSNVRNHLSFGFGIHRCLGMRLGELQLKILFEEILARYDRVEITDQPQRVLSNFINGYSKMSVILHEKR